MRRVLCAVVLSALPLGAFAAPPAHAVICEPLIEEIPRELDPRCVAFYVMCRGGAEAGRLIGQEVHCAA